ncbi:hypothetical protein S40288_09238 [Stachybotrys chartarum IBT 40288]|nr:hypothetical protein S40288_09238 [Stachybotrys chartarum IBT 40288]
MSTAANSTRRIALVICSTRSSRLNPFITNYVDNVIVSSPHRTNTGRSISILDLKDQGLPLYDEPEVPSYLPSDNPTPDYTHEHTRRWSAIIRQYDAFIFVTPQYNWSIPAGLKNALDYLFHEWAGKPTAIVSYGGKGGGRSNAVTRGEYGSEAFCKAPSEMEEESRGDIAK